MSQSKQCSRCKQIKQFDEFAKKKSAKSGIGARCLQCCREVDKARYPARRENRLIYLSNWRANNQDYIKQYRIDYYSINSVLLREKSMAWYWVNIDKAKATRKLYAIENKEYLAQIAQEWQRNNPEKVAARNKKYKTAHPEKVRESEAKRRALMYENGVYFIRHKELQKLYSDKCFYCPEKENIEADHVIAIKRGGVHGIGNLLPACRSCNGSKGEKTIMEWRVWKERQGR